MSAMSRPDVERLAYSPAKSYPYDLEVFRLSDLKRRSSVQAMRRTYCYEFYMLICVTQGECTHFVDFEPVMCTAGTLLIIRPDQAHNFGSDEDWDGWLVLLRPALLLSGTGTLGGANDAAVLQRLPERICLGTKELERAEEDIRRIRDDALLGTVKSAGNAPAPGAVDVSASALNTEVQALLRYRFYALLSWLSILHGQRPTLSSSQSSAALRFLQFQALVDQKFTQWSQLGDYANHLGCTEKSLTRSTLAARGITAKAYLSNRIVLEAKRLLMRTDLPVAALSNKLGFEETDRFCKFFKRETQCTPKDFRKRSGTF